MTQRQKPSTAVDYASRPDVRSCPRCGGIVHPDDLYAHREPPAGDGSRDAFAGLDEGIRVYVRTLWENGIETYESCQGGADPERPERGHAYPEPTVAFHGGVHKGFQAYAIAKCMGLPVRELRRVWREQDGELTGPTWHMTFGPVSPR